MVRVLLPTSPPGYFWTDIYDTKYINRVLSQKSNLFKLLQDDNIDLSRTEKEIMKDHNYVRTFDSGLIKWVCIRGNYYHDQEMYNV